MVPDRRGSGRQPFSATGRFPVPAYSEFMPPPFVGIKPFTAPAMPAAPRTPPACATSTASPSTSTSRSTSWGLAWPRSRATWCLSWASWPRARPTSSPALCSTDNLAWPESLAAAARAGRYPQRPFFVMQPLALSRTQDDKGNVRWTLFGASHEPASAVFWRGFAEADEERFLRLIAWASGDEPLPARGLCVCSVAAAELPGFARASALARARACRAHPHALHPGAIRCFARFVAESLSRRDAAHSAHARQPGVLRASLAIASWPRPCRAPRRSRCCISFPTCKRATRFGFPSRVGSTSTIPARRGPRDPIASSATSRARTDGSARRATKPWSATARSPTRSRSRSSPPTRTISACTASRWRATRRSGPTTINSCSTAPARARPSWNTPPSCSTAAAASATASTIPRCAAGTRELFWHLPLLARLDPGSGSWRSGRTRFASARSPPKRPRPPASALFCSRPISSIVPAIAKPPSLFAREPGQLRHTTAQNLRKLLDFREYLAGPLPASFARALLRIAKDTTLDAWLAKLPQLASDKRPRPVCSTICARTSRPRSGWARRSPSQTPQPARLKKRSGGPSRPWPRENIGTRKPPTGW